MDLIKDQFADLWNDFTECDYQLIDNLDDFLDTTERLGLAECVPVDREALEEPFADERGIEPGGMMWRLTELGQLRYHQCRAKEIGA